MKNEKNNQGNREEQPQQKNSLRDQQLPSDSKQQSNNSQQQGNGSQRQMGSNGGNEKSNIAVDNEGRIGKAHDQWNNDNNDRNQQEERNGQQNENQMSNEQSIGEPGMDEPMTDPGMNDKKMPKMNTNTQGDRNR